MLATVITTKQKLHENYSKDPRPRDSHHQWIQQVQIPVT